MDRRAIEDALRAWVVTATQLAQDRVVFAHEALRLPETEARAIITVGDQLNLMGVDQLTSTFNAGNPAGQEFVERVDGLRELVVSVQTFAPSPSETGVPPVTAIYLADRCQASLGLPSVRDALRAGGVGVLQAGAVQRVPTVRALGYEDRAVLAVRCCVVASAEERTGYVSTFGLESEVDA